MDRKDSDVDVEYTTGDIESFKDVIDYSMDGNIAIITHEDRQSVIPYENVKSIKIYNTDVL